MKKKVTKPKKKPKIFDLEWVFEPLLEHDSFYTKPMFGCKAAYCHDKIVLLLAENPGDMTFRDKTFSFEVWNGVLIPTDREYHLPILKKYPNLLQHPVLGKWLYLPLSDSCFEDTIVSIVHRIDNNDPMFGTYPKLKKQNKVKKITKK